MSRFRNYHKPYGIANIILFGALNIDSVGGEIKIEVNVIWMVSTLEL